MVVFSVWVHCLRPSAMVASRLRNNPLIWFDPTQKERYIDSFFLHVFLPFFWQRPVKRDRCTDRQRWPFVLLSFFLLISLRETDRHPRTFFLAFSANFLFLSCFHSFFLFFSFASCFGFHRKQESSSFLSQICCVFSWSHSFPAKDISVCYCQVNGLPQRRKTISAGINVNQIGSVFLHFVGNSISFCLLRTHLKLCHHGRCTMAFLHLINLLPLLLILNIMYRN